MNNSFKKLGIRETAQYLSRPMQTLVVYHARPDGDTVGCALAIASAMRAHGSKVYVVGEDEIPERLVFLCQRKNMSHLYENLPEKFSAERIVTVDAAAPELLGSIWEKIEGRVSLMIDHHELNIPFADNCIKAESASCGEIVKDIIFEMFPRRSDIPADILDCCYAAISSDTGCFKYSNVTPETHKTAAELILMGVNAANINTLLFDTKSEKQLRAESLAAQRMSLHSGGRVSVVTFPYELKEANGLLDEHLETIVDIARCVSGVSVALAVKQPKKDNKYRISLRSNSNVDVSKICAAFGGGGHKKAAGCTVEACDADTAAKMVLAKINV